jgi:hypothetical protein
MRLSTDCGRTRSGGWVPHEVARDESCSRPAIVGDDDLALIGGLAGDFTCESP